MTPPLHAWNWPADARAVQLHSGLINPTWRVEHGGPLAILQQLNTRIFRASVHEDIAAVTAHLLAKGVPTPTLIPTRAGGLWHEDDEGGIWRAMTHVGRDTVHSVGSLAAARSAGELVARWHGATHDLDWVFRHVRPGAHDTDRHLALLDTALDSHRDHRLRDAVAPLADRLRSGWAALSQELPTLPQRVVHGDLKISNLRFDGDEAIAIIDLDTCARDTLGAELGDAMRSWCGTAGEDSPDASFDLDVFGAAMAGYAAGAQGVTEPEWDAIVPSTERIATELAMRFAADALNESYFGWDAERFETAGQHNLVRAQGQANLATAVRLGRGDAEKRLRAARTHAP